MKKHNSFSFIHAADLHLDSPFKGITTDSKSIGNTLRSATFDAFNTLIDLCIAEQVRFLLVAGDVYDGADKSLRAQLKFRDGLARLSEHNIHTFVVHGNHDPAPSQSVAIEWPVNVHIFDGNKVESKTVTGHNDVPMAIISGISHAKGNETQNLTRKFSKEDPGVFHIGLLHCNVGSNTGHDPYAPCELPDLTNLGMDYWALGHVHEKVILSTNPYVVYSGNTQGSNIREQGERGCYLVTVEDRFVADIRFCPLGPVRWIRANVSIDGMNTIDQLERAIGKNIQELQELMGSQHQAPAIVLRVNIVGNGPLYNELQKENAILDLLDRTREAFASEDPFVWVQEIEANCRPEIDLEKLKQRGDFLGQVVKIAETINDPKGNIPELLKPVLSDLFENRHIQKALEELSQDEMSRIIERATLLCVNMLEGNE
ncbi:MAG: DNA repair exonuclease [Proteobacteria bacterium]|nr:DNA repair exonuclease [Pseudomonadota bacterium]